MTKRIYLDNAATTPLRLEVKEAIMQALSVFGNPSSVHREGQDARFLLDGARRNVAKLINCRSEQVIFTSSGTESNVTAINGVMHHPSAVGKQLATSPTEHDCVINTAKRLQEEGVSVEFIKVDSNGVIDLTHLEQILKHGTTRLVSLMHANNETGVMQPIAEACKLAHKYGAYMHVDATQSVGHIPVDFEELGVDLLVFSGHKIGAPKGAGVLVVKPSVEMHSLITGGAQEKSRRAGTENMLSIVGLGAACEVLCESLTQENGDLNELHAHLENGLSKINGIQIIGQYAPRVPHVTQILLPEGKKGEDMVIALDLKGIAVSQGSACSSGRIEPSHVLTAQGLTTEQASRSLRISLGWANDEGDVALTLKLLGSLV